MHARERGAAGVLVPVLAVAAAGRAWTGDQRRAFADAGEAVDLGEQLGDVADVAVASEMLAWQSASRGLHDDAREAPDLGEAFLRVGRRDDARVLAGRFAAATPAEAPAWTGGLGAPRAGGAPGGRVRTPPRGPVAGEPLTAQETRVAAEVARGRSDREIAAALFVSPKTVERHLSNIFRKQGLRSRTQPAMAFREVASP